MILLVEIVSAIADFGNSSVLDLDNGMVGKSQSLRLSFGPKTVRKPVFDVIEVLTTRYCDVIVESPISAMTTSASSSLAAFRRVTNSLVIMPGIEGKASVVYIGTSRFGNSKI